MAKRFTDTTKWDDEWFCDLSSEHKLAWLYILDKADHAGIFKPNMKLMNFMLDSSNTKESLLSALNDGKGRIRELHNGKWFLEGFISYQYGDHLNAKNRAHKSVLNLLESNAIDKTSIRGLKDLKDGAKDKDTDKEQDKSKDKDKNKEQDKEKDPNTMYEIKTAIEALECKIYSHEHEGAEPDLDLEACKKQLSDLQWRAAQKVRVA